MPNPLNYTKDIAPLMERYQRGELTAKEVVKAVVRMARVQRGA